MSVYDGRVAEPPYPTATELAGDVGREPYQEIVTIIHHADGEEIKPRGTGYAVRCAAHIAHENLPDARWALEVLNRFGHLVSHPADSL
jgi:hypothetical protein